MFTITPLFIFLGDITVHAYVHVHIHLHVHASHPQGARPHFKERGKKLFNNKSWNVAWGQW